MSTLSLGTTVEFDSSEADEKSIAALSSTKFVIAFSDATDSNKGKVIIGTLSGTTITITNDSAITFDSGQVSSMQVTRMSDTVFMIVYKDDSETACKAICGSVSGTTITLGTEFEITASTIRGCGVAGIDTTYAVAVYDVFPNLIAQLLSISGTTISTVDSPVNVETPVGDGFVQVVKLDSTHVAWCFSDYLFVNKCSVQGAIIDTDGPTYISAGTAATLGVGINTFSISAFDERYVLIAVASQVTGWEVDPATGNVTFINSVQYDANGLLPAVACTDSTHWIVAYYDSTDSDKGKIARGTHSAGIPTLDIADTEFEADDTDVLAACKMADQTFIVAYKHA